MSRFSQIVMLSNIETLIQTLTKALLPDLVFKASKVAKEELVEAITTPRS